MEEVHKVNEFIIYLRLSSYLTDGDTRFTVYELPKRMVMPNLLLDITISRKNILVCNCESMKSVIS